jgi:hypothetical protein
LIKSFKKDDVEYISECFKNYNIFEQHFDNYKDDLKNGESDRFQSNYKYTIHYLDKYQLEDKNDKQFNNFLKDIKRIFKEDDYIYENCNKIPYKHMSGEIYYKYVQEKVKNDTFIGAQCLQQTIKKVDRAYESFNKLIGKGIYANIPEYLDKKGYYNVIFQKNSFKIKKVNGKNMIVLALGRDMQNEYKELFGKNNDIIIINETYYGYKDKILKYAKKVTDETKKTGNLFFKYNMEDYYINGNNKYLYETRNIHFSIGEKIAKHAIKEVEIKI